MRISWGVVLAPLVVAIACEPSMGQSAPPTSPKPGSASQMKEPVSSGERRETLASHVRAMVQDKQGNMWFGTDGQGIARYDGKAFTFLTEKQGLPNDYVRTIQEDKVGNLWITTRDGLCKYDGKTFTRIEVPINENAPLPRPTPEMMWFCAQGGAIYFDGSSLGYLPLPFDAADRDLQRDQPGINPYAIYSAHKARDGSVWFGTESRGVCRYDQSGFTWFRDKDLDKPAVRAILADSRGDAWFGNSGGGLYRYDGKALANFSLERGVDNLSWMSGAFIRMPGKLADPHAIYEDKDGMIWIGAFDSGVWKYDGKTLANITDGGAPDCVSSILQDRSGKMWFGAFRGVYTFDGKTFQQVGAMPKARD